MFESLNGELKKWSDSDKLAEFWWRDDDAQKPSAQLDQLLAIGDRHQVALSLATIPDGVEASLVDELSGRELVSILQHGYSHRNYAPETERKMELGWHRSSAQIMGQVHSGLTSLRTLFGEQFNAIMVPPWNRIDQRVVECLKGAGLNGLSTLGPRNQYCPVEGIKQVNVHVDIINWKQGRRFAGEAACIEQIVAHLSAKREGQVDSDEPTGIMSHHLVHDTGCWDFLDELFGFLACQSNAQVLAAGQIF